MKGKQKAFNYWLKDEIEDYVFETEHSEYSGPLLAFEHILYPSQAQEQHQVQSTIKGVQKKPMKNIYIRYQQNFNPLLPFEAIFKKDTLPRFFSFLAYEDMVQLMKTCKFFYSFIDNKKIWSQFLIRDFSSYKADIPYSSPKDLYKYFVQTTQSSLVYHTGLFIQKSKEVTKELMRTLVDFTVPKNELIYLVSWRIKRSRGDFKLSLNKEKNEAYLWISGYEEEKKGVETSFNPTSEIIKKYIFRQKEEIQNGFFLENKYLVFQLREKEEEKLKDSKELRTKIQYNLEEEKISVLNEIKYNNISQSFLVMDLIDEIRYGGNGSETPYKFNFLIDFTNQGDNISQIISNDEQREFTIHVYPYKKHWENKIEIKFVNSYEVVFYMKNSTSSIFLLFDLKDKKILCNTILNFESPLIDLVPINKLQESNEFALTFFAIDEDYNIYNITYQQSNFKMNKVNFELPGNSPKDKQIQEFDNERFPTTKKKYYHGNLANSKGSSKNVIAFFKDSRFHFIQTETCQISHFTMNKECLMCVNKIYDWNINNNSLFVITDDGLLIFNISLFDHPQAPRVQVQTQWAKTDYFGQWIYSNSTYTLLLSSFYKEYGDVEKLELIVGSTQDYLAGGYKDISTRNLYKFVLPKRLKIPLRVGSSFKYIPEILDSKFEEDRFLVKTCSSNFFIDLGVCLKERRLKFGGWRKNNIILSLIPSPSALKKVDKEEKNAVKITEPIAHSKIPIGNKKKEKNQNWKGCEKKLDKEERQEDRVIRHKGTKYYKNSRQSGSRIKHDL